MAVRLSIITINRNDASGLEKTIQSVLSQTYSNINYVVVDGGSSDGSVEVVRKYESLFGGRMKWISEPDKGIYNAMNKGIGMAAGEYFQFLNSGDCLVDNEVTGKMCEALTDEGYPTIIYGNMLKKMPSGKIVRDRCFAGQSISFLGFYNGSLNHSSAYIHRGLFDKYGMYDESLRIVSDWKWFLQVIVLGGEKPMYADIDISLFDMNGISETNKELNRQEREQVLAQLVPPAILADYEEWAFPIEQMKRLKRHAWAYKMVWFLERCLFKMEKRKK